MEKIYVNQSWKLNKGKALNFLFLLPVESLHFYTLSLVKIPKYEEVSGSFVMRSCSQRVLRENSS